MILSNENMRAFMDIRNLKNISAILLGVTFGLSSLESFAMSKHEHPEKQSSIIKRKHKGTKIRFKNLKPKKNDSFSLTAGSDLPLRDLVMSYLEPFSIPDEIVIKADRDFVKDNGRKSLFYSFYIDGLRIDQNYLKANRHKDGSVFLVGDIPDVDLYQGQFYSSNFPDAASVLSSVVEELTERGHSVDADKVKLSAHQGCATVREGKLYRAVCVDVSYMGEAFKMTIDQQGVSGLSLNSFYATATLKGIFLENSMGDKADHKVYVTSSTYLENNRFTVIPYDGDKVKSVNDEFSFTDIDSSEARQINAFSFANRMFDWYDSLGVQISSKQVKVKTGVEFEGGNIDNAAFIPSTWSIEIGAGSGKDGFTNLGLDIDVVAHEVGHFIVFSGINNLTAINEATNDHTQAVHEGLADYFTFASTGDACLAESVCQGSRMCIKTNCLRVGENIGFKFKDSTYNSLGNLFHLKGQIMAAALWGARKQLSSSEHFEFDQIVANALDYVPSGGLSYGDVVMAVMASDKELQGGKFCQKIYDSAVALDLGSLIDTTCEAFVGPDKQGRNVVDTGDASRLDYSKGIKSSASAELTQSSSAGSRSGSVGRKPIDSGGCASIGIGSNEASPLQTLLIIMTVLFFPLGLNFIGAQAKLQKVRVRVKSDFKHDRRIK